MRWEQYAQDGALKTINVGAQVVVPSVRVTKSANQSLTSGSPTVISFDTETFDTDGIHDNATNNSRLTCRTPGKYLVHGILAFATNATGARYWRLDKSGVAGWEYFTIPAIGGSINAFVVGATVMDLAAGEYVEMTGFQDSGGALNALGTTPGNTEFGMTYLGPGLVSSGALPYMVTKLPTVALHQQQVIYQPDPVSNPWVLWHMFYDAYASDANKWKFIGGSQLEAMIDTTQQGLSNGTWHNLTTDGPKIVLPNSGSYDTEWQTRMTKTKAEAQSAYVGLAIGDTAPGYTTGWFDPWTGTTDEDMQLSRRSMFALTGGTTLKMRYFTVNNSGTSPWIAFTTRRMAIKPIALAP